MDDDRRDAGLGGGFWLKFIGVLVLGGLGMILAWVLFERAWYRWGLIGAFAVFSAVLLGIAYIGDRRSQRRYEDIVEG